MARSEHAATIITEMTNRIRHRGPDDGGHWIDPDSGIVLGHRRLSIVDLSAAGSQPMASAAGRYVIAYNGEIYNHMEIRKEIECQTAVAWRGHSDTETFLAAVDLWDLDGAVQRAVGMFAFALWDRRDRRLHLVRDRLGEKPLSFTWWQGNLLFASELVAFKSFPGFAPGIDHDALYKYMCTGSVPAPLSIFDGVRKVRPGQIVTFDFSKGATPGTEIARTYWSVRDSAQGARFSGSAQDAVAELERRLQASVAHQMVADVPVGAFLSGGVDSSAVVALMQQASSRPVRTFSIGFEEGGFDESHHAAAVAKHLGTDHTEMLLTAADALAMIPTIGAVWDEPFADSSQVPTQVVSALARKQVTVCLSGDGGDELFCGYDRYFAARAIENIPAKGLLRTLLAAVPSPLVVSVAQAMPSRMLRRLSAHRLNVLRNLLAQETRYDRYLTLCYQPDHNREYVADSSGGSLIDWYPPASVDYMNGLGAIDVETYLPNDILTKVDRAAMSVSLETRVPLLDHRVVEFAFNLPSKLKLQEGKSKWPLRQLLYKHVPPQMIERPKMGFGVPMDIWLRGPLREWADDLLSPSQLAREDLFNAAAVERIWAEHKSGVSDNASRLWKVLSYQNWRHSNA